MEQKKNQKGDIVAWEVNDQGEQAVCVATEPDWFQYCYNHDANGEMFFSGDIPNDVDFVEPSIDTLKKFVTDLHGCLLWSDKALENLRKIASMSPFKIHNGEHWLTIFPELGKPETFCRKTGMKDADGQDIYEGDIILSLDCSVQTYIAKVVLYDESHAAMSAMWVSDDKDDLCCNMLYMEEDCNSPIVIGNIHDDTKLAKTLLEGLEEAGVKLTREQSAL